MPLGGTRLPRRIQRVRKNTMQEFDGQLPDGAPCDVQDGKGRSGKLGQDWQNLYPAASLSIFHLNCGNGRHAVPFFRAIG